MPLLLLLDFACIVHVVFMVVNWPRKDGKGEVADGEHFNPAVTHVLGGIVPIGVAATMTWLFLIVGFATTVQLNVGSPERMNVWSTWVDLFPVFLLLTFISGLANLIRFFACVFRRQKRVGAPVSAAAFLLSLLAFVTVAAHFPSA